MKKTRILHCIDIGTLIASYCEDPETVCAYAVAIRQTDCEVWKYLLPFVLRMVKRHAWLFSSTVIFDLSPAVTSQLLVEWYRIEHTKIYYHGPLKRQGRKFAEVSQMMSMRDIIIHGICDSGEQWFNLYMKHPLHIE